MERKPFLFVWIKIISTCLKNESLRLKHYFIFLVWLFEIHFFHLYFFFQNVSYWYHSLYFLFLIWCLKFIISFCPFEPIHISITLLQTCRLIENEYLGLKNGILDQSAILLSSYGCLTCMNCKVNFAISVHSNFQDMSFSNCVLYVVCLCIIWCRIVNVVIVHNFAIQTVILASEVMYSSI